MSELPEAYVLGEWDFYNITLKITPDVLIPRSDTEHLVDVALEYLRNLSTINYQLSTLNCLDLCCGSGCIGLAIEANCPGVEVTYGDISEAALAVARDNGCKDARLLDALKPPPTDFGHYDVLVCNPPYVRPDDPALDKSVLDHEPHIALFGAGEPPEAILGDGLDFYRALFPDWLSVLKPGGLFIVEVGYDQAGVVKQMAGEAGLEKVNIRKDYAGHDRVVYGNRRGGEHG
ncbi:MAG: peptide chain release factor N(5)-glutamine methyltransferase [Oscillospiraceae bacterium]|nr:peptide chain release factor N(5)-glutamine methyltransferase [Oscillospiraceae bacterium]